MQSTNRVAVAVAGLNRDYTLPASTLQREVVHRRTFSVTVCSGRQNKALTNDREGDNFVIFGQLDASDARRATPHGAHIFFLETNRLAMTGDEQYFRVAIGNGHIHQFVVTTQVQRNDAIGAWA